MNSLILAAAARLLLPLLLLFSLFVLFRGHNEPGGGFIGGLVAASGFALYSLAYGASDTRQLMRVDSRSLALVGLAVALGSGAFSMTTGRAFMTASWVRGFGTPLVFDMGVYLLVVGIAMTIILALAEDLPWKS